MRRLYHFTSVQYLTIPNNGEPGRVNARDLPPLRNRSELLLPLGDRRAAAKGR